MSDKNSSADKGVAAAAEQANDRDDVTNDRRDAADGGAVAATPPAPRTGGGSGLAVLSLLLVAGVGVGAYLFWQENGEEHQRFAQRMDQIDKAVVPVANVSAKLSMLESRLARIESGLPEGLDGRLRSIDEAIASLRESLASQGGQAVDLSPLEQRVAALEASLADFATRSQQWLDRAGWEADKAGLEGRIETLTEQVAALRSRQGDAGQRLLVAEAGHLLRIADEALGLRRDPTTARQSLERAAAVLEPVAAAAGLRQSIAKALADIEAVRLPDVAGLSSELESLEATLPQLAQPGTEAPRSASSAGGEAGGGAIDSVRSFLAAIWDSIRSLVTIRRSGADDAPLRSPDQQRYLVENLRLKIESARLALLRNDEAVFKEDLKSAREMLAGYFVSDDPAVAAAIETLDRISATTIAPGLPDLTGLIEAADRLQAGDGLASVAGLAEVTS